MNWQEQFQTKFLKSGIPFSHLTESRVERVIKNYWANLVKFLKSTFLIISVARSNLDFTNSSMELLTAHR